MPEGEGSLPVDAKKNVAKIRKKARLRAKGDMA
jgi:hypothetical protein